MKKKSISLILLSLLLLAGYVPMVSTHGGTVKVDYPEDPTHLVIDTIGEPESLDPAWAYDASSTEVVMNVYETLVFFDRDYTLGAPEARGPYEAGLVYSFIPMLATEVLIEDISETSPEGLTWVKRFTFRIRDGVLFHDGISVLMPEDVEYSFERLLVQDRDGGPAWTIYEPLLHVYGAADPFTDPLWGLKIDHAVENNATHVWFNLVKDYPDTLFMQILSQPWSSVVNQAWCIAHGDLDVDSVIGGWSNWQFIWDMWHNPDFSFINDVMMGTGPYRFSYWTGGVSWSITRFPTYWDGWPARVSRDPVSPLYNERIGGFITTVTWEFCPNWPTRRASFLAGDVDMSYVPRQSRDQLTPCTPGQPDYKGVRCFYPLGMLALDAFFFTFDIDDTTLYAGGPGGHGYPSGEFHEDGIPRNIFGIDPDTGVDEGLIVRMGFAYAFNYLEYLDSAYLGEGYQPADPVIHGLLYDRLTVVEDETWEKHNELAPVNGIYDAGESIYFDADNSFTVSAGDVLLAGPALPTGTPLISFGIVLANDEKHAENVAGDGWYNVAARYADSNGNNEWDVGEPAIRDSINNGIYDAGDTVLCGVAPAIGTVLCDPDDFERYADTNVDNKWDVDEPAIRDNNDNGIFDPTVDTLLVWAVPSTGALLRDPVESIYRDLDHDGTVSDAGDIVLAGTAPAVGTGLNVPDDFEKYADTDDNNEWDVFEPAIRDNNNDWVYDAGDTVLCGAAPLLGTGLKVPDDFEKYAESVAVNNEWDVFEPAIRDNNNDDVYGDILIQGPAQPPGTTLVSFVGKWKYVYNPSLAAYFLQLAWGGVDANGNGIIDPINEPGDMYGPLWTSGMSFTIVYNVGNDARMLSANMIATNINGLNQLFALTVLGVIWPIYQGQMVASWLPLFINGWTADFTDPHDFVHPFMHSQGTFASAQGYVNPTVDMLIEQGIQTPDGPPREAIYRNLQEDYFFDVPSVPLVQPLGRHWERDWVRGWYYNPLYGGSLTPGIDSTAPATPTLYVYHLWKSKTHFGDANNDGLVNIVDWGKISAHWTAADRPYNILADLSGGTGGTTGSLWGPVRGIPDGEVNMHDKGIVSAYWDGPPQGPSHP